MTQSVSLKEMLEKHNYEVVGAVIGRSERRVVPDFILNRLGVETYQVESPNFVTDKNNKGVKYPRINF